MRQAIIGVLIALFLSIQSPAPAQLPISSGGHTVTGIVTAAYPSHILVSHAHGAKTLISRFIIGPATKIDGRIVAGVSVTVVYHRARRARRVSRSIASLIIVVK
jgi:hypothetical protein